MKTSNWLWGKTLIVISVAFLVISAVGCGSAATPIAPAPTQAPKSEAVKEATPAAKQSQSETKETKPQAEAKKEPKKLTKITVAYSAIAGAQAPMWIAKEKGLYEKYGLDVDLQYIATSTTLTQAMISGEIPIAQTGGNSVVTANLAGGDLTIIAINAPVIGYMFFGQPNINSLEDLKGKTVAITRFGSNTDFAARYTLRKYGLEPEKDVAIVQAGGVPQTMAAMLSGGVQGTVTGPPNSVTLKKAGMRVLVNIADLEIPYVQTNIAVSKKFMAGNEETVRNFLKAFVEAIAVAKTDKAFAMKVLAEYTKTEDKDVLEETYDYFLDKIVPKVPYAKAEAVQTVLDEMASENEKVKGIKPESIIDNRLLKELDDSGFIKKLYE